MRRDYFGFRRGEYDLRAVGSPNFNVNILSGLDFIITVGEV